MSNCKVCGEPMPEGEEMFNYHGYSGPCPKPPLAWKAEFVQQNSGATVAEIRVTDDAMLEVVKLSDDNFSLVIHNRVGETDRFDDLSIKLEHKHFVMLGSIAVDRS